MEPLVSIIIPVYNVEKYLDKCVQSVLNQTYHNLEIILVDDGSTDSSGKICCVYAKQDTRVCVIHKKNGGLANARNTALEICKGEYITFLDSDDYIAVSYIEKMYGLAHEYNCDMVRSQIKAIDESGSEQAYLKTVYEVQSLVPQEALKRALYQNNNVTICACGVLYHKKLVHNVTFQVDNRYAEDLLFTCETMMLSNCVVISPKRDYFYLQRKGSINNNTFNEQMLVIFAITEKLYEIVTQQYPLLKKAALSKKISANASVLLKMPNGLHQEIQQKAWLEIKRNRIRLLVDVEARSKEKVLCILSFLGLKVVRFVYKNFI